MPRLSCSIDGVDVNRGVTQRAWIALDLQVLLAPADQRGSDVLVPGASGVLPQRRRRTVSERSVSMLVTGATDRLGVPASDRHRQLVDNLLWLRDNLVAPPGSGDGTRTLTLYLPDGSTRSAAVHVVGLEVGEHVGHAVRAVLRLSIPGGQI